MGSTKRFEVMVAWQTARALTRSVFELTDSDTFSQDFDFKDQIHRTSISIVSNIAESFDPRTKVSPRDYLRRALGFAGELRTHLFVALNAGYISAEQSQSLQEQCAKSAAQISTLLRHLQPAYPPPPKSPRPKLPTRPAH
jgi:four helix bundle protein